MEHKNDVKKMEQLKPKRPTIPNHLVAHQQLKNSPRRRRKVVRHVYFHVDGYGGPRR